MAGASKIIAVDINPDKFKNAIELGATDCVDSSKLDIPVQQYIAGKLTKWGVDYSFDCTGNVNVMRSALECVSCPIRFCFCVCIPRIFEHFLTL